MDVSRLNRDELEYELKVRGIDNVAGETCKSMRSKLKEIASEEEFGSIIKNENLGLDNIEEVDICNSKIVELQAYIESRDKLDARYIETKLHHLYARLNRLSITDNEENRDVLASRKNLLKELGSIEEFLDETLYNRVSVVEINKNVDQVAENAAAAEVSLPSQQVTNVYKSSPIHKWDISFTGEKSSISVNAFIERVEEYKMARGVKDSDLYSSVVDLLRGKALIWYRSVRSQISSWTDFVKALREEFLPFDYETDLWNEIRSRVQGPNERIGEYFACMINLFSRLSVKPAHKEQLTILRRNITPYFIHGLGLRDINSVEELLMCCKKLESAKELANKSRTPSNKLCLLEPDLACSTASSSSYSENRRGRNSVSSIQPRNNNGRCWNCGNEGHSFSDCSIPRARKFCFRCGRANVTKYTCQCNSKNARGDQR